MVSLLLQLLPLPLLLLLLLMLLLLLLLLLLWRTASGNASAATSDGAAPDDDSRAPIAPLSGVIEVTVPLVAGAAFDTASDDAAPADDSRAPTASLSGGAEGTVPLAVDAAPADDVGASATAFEDAAGKTLVSCTASVADGVRGFLPCFPSPPDVWVLRDGSCSGCGCRVCRAGGKAWDLR